MTLLYAEELKKMYEVKAHFYIRQDDPSKQLMRSEAVIHAKNASFDEPDAVIVMANPGSCFAADEADIPQSPDADGAKRFVRAKPDQTQYQLMNLMHRMNWKALRIINLSDFCTGNYKEFKAMLKAADNDSHSIFSSGRTNELEKAIQNRTVVIGWGQDSAIRSFAEQALTVIQKDHYGLTFEKHPYYRHPKPQLKTDKIHWLDNMTAQLNSSYA
ncbi:hypothetical protein KP77_28230 [Jeotgalibacillus alimentarius]|uniref:DUF1643 domain-containing protein n=1 Tax=Jeotgalibacillus alimentarius TaxID=135826 RepID=A0A0C2VQI2_9BACL|nr:DUF1643 domain-containing protein [Jeotgalibacillus alimentarius]KIL46696.1 hypothetical protein KP77_28230 [Jeotgalibacillus alimentarius]